MQKPSPTAGLRHVALFSKNLETCKAFYTDLLGLSIVWQPDDDNIYLSSGSDNVALHRAPVDFNPIGSQHLDHIGFFLNDKGDVDHWHLYLKEAGVPIKYPPKDHRDGSRSFYFTDPDDRLVQFIYIKL